MPGRVSAIALAALLLAACNSKNPDALNAASVEENYAVTDSNLAENVDAGSSTENGAAPAGAGPATEAVNSSHANVDAAVNMLKEAEADQNEYCDAQQEATGESDCDEN